MCALRSWANKYSSSLLSECYQDIYVYWLGRQVHILRFRILPLALVNMDKVNLPSGRSHCNVMQLLLLLLYQIAYDIRYAKFVAQLPIRRWELTKSFSAIIITLRNEICNLSSLIQLFTIICCCGWFMMKLNDGSA